MHFTKITMQCKLACFLNRVFTLYVPLTSRRYIIEVNCSWIDLQRLGEGSHRKTLNAQSHSYRSRGTHSFLANTYSVDQLSPWMMVWPTMTVLEEVPLTYRISFQNQSRKSKPRLQLMNMKHNMIFLKWCEKIALPKIQHGMTWPSLLFSH